MTCSRSLLILYFIYSSMHKLIPASLFIPPSPHVSLLVTISLFFKCVSISGIPSGTSGKDLPANAGDIKGKGLIPESGRSPGGGHRNPLQYSCLKHSMDRGAWQSLVHRVPKSQTQLKRFSMHAHMSIFLFSAYVHLYNSVHFSSVQSLSSLQLFATP